MKLGDGAADKVKENISDALMLLSNIAFEYIKDKIKDIPKGIEKLIGSTDAQKDIVALWSKQL